MTQDISKLPLVLVDFSMSVWTGRKMDKKVSEEVDAQKGTKTRAGNYHKDLMAGAAQLDKIRKIQTAAREWHYSRTLPWLDNGPRVLPVALMFDYKQVLNDYETQFNDAVEEFLREYPQLVSVASFQLGALFKNDEYPDVEDLRRKFRFKCNIVPLPSSGDFRLDLTNEILEDLKQEYEGVYNTKLNEAMGETWSRLFDVVKALSDKLSDKERTRKNGSVTNTQTFRDSLVGNAVEMCSLLTGLNITNDPKMEEARKKLEAAICNVSAEQLRESDEVRHSVKSKVDDILKNFDF